MTSYALLHKALEKYLLTKQVMVNSVQLKVYSSCYKEINLEDPSSLFRESDFSGKMNLRTMFLS